VDESDAGTAVGIVLDGGDRTGNAILVTPEIDDPVAAFVPTALVPGGLPAHRIAASASADGLEQRLRWPRGLRALDQLVVGERRHVAARRRGWFELLERHGLHPLEVFDGLRARLEPDIGLLPVRTVAGPAA